METEARRPKGRSPSYPAINLELAVQRARELYEKDRQHSTPATAAAKRWGYKSLNGPAAQVLAALKKYGLAEDEGVGDARRVRVTDLAVDILANPEPAARRAAIEKAALRPAIHREMWEEFGTGLPSDETLRWELTRERSFTETGATEFIRSYKATVAFAQLPNKRVTSAQEPAQDLVQISVQDVTDDDEPGQTDVLPTNVAASRSTPPSADSKAFPIPLIEGGIVTVEGNFPLSERDWSHFITVLDAMKPGLVSTQEQDNSVS